MFVVLKVLTERTNYALNHPFSYVYKGKINPQIGQRVLIPFNEKVIVGYILNIEHLMSSQEQYEKECGYKLLEIICLLDKEPLLNEELSKLAYEVADYYLSPLISVYQTMLPPSLKPTTSAMKKPHIAYETFVRCVNENEEDLTLKQIELLRLIKSVEEVNKRDLKSPSILKKLIEHGNVVEIKREKIRFNYASNTSYEEIHLTNEQSQVVEEFFHSNDQTYLLEGVTGSGKTEVYLEIVKRLTQNGKTAIILVPEISLTPVMMQRLYHVFKKEVAILHSELSNGEKYDEYRRISRQEVKVVIGTRSAVFAPLKNLGVIIIDEEHVESYKQDNVPCYHAKEVAIMRASHFEGCKVLLGSATPSLESMARALRGVYHHLKLNKRIYERELPATTIINMQDYRNIDYNSAIFSLKLRDEIRKTIDRGEQVVLLLNRRGHSTSMICRECGYVFKCPNCQIPLVYHQSDHLLKCHNCGYVNEVALRCEKCGSPHLMKIGFGSEKVENECRKLFPDAKILRLDSDVGKIKNNVTKILTQFENKEANILIGTQMIAKGHNFPNVTLVGLVLADLGLTLPLTRSSETTFQLITQAIGRAGRGDKKGQAIIQTYMPKHYAIVLGAQQNYESFFANEMKIRKLQQTVPYMYLSSLTITAKTEESAEELIVVTMQIVSKESQNKIICLGPSKPYVNLVNNGYRRICLFKYRDKSLFNDIMKQIMQILIKKNGISIKIDVDAMNV